MCREAAVPELAVQLSGILFVRMWVCDLVMSRSITVGGVYVPGTVSEISATDL